MKHNVSHDKKQRPVRSYVKRQGRMTPSQHHALEVYWQQYGLSPTTEKINFTELFGRDAPCVLEIGFGMGHSLWQQAQAQPSINFLGIEVHRPGVGSLLLAVHKYQLTNVRIICQDAMEILTHNIPDHSFSKIQIFFPDPWPKKRHHKRRLIQADFLNLIRQKLQLSGIVHIATDWQDYAEQILDVFHQDPHWQNQSPDQTYLPRPMNRPFTKFEKRGQALGHGVWDMVFKLRST